MTMADERPKLPYAIYEDLCGQTVAWVLETVTVEMASQVDRDLIGLSAETPITRIERITLGYDDLPVEWRH